MRAAKILQDHVERGKKLIPPFVHHFGAFEEVSWRNDVLPQVVWIAVVHQALGDARAVELLTAFTRIVRKHLPKAKLATLMGISEFAQLSQRSSAQLIVELRAWPDYFELRNALSLLLSNYPDSPLSNFFAPVAREPQDSSGELDQISGLLSELMPRHSRTATMTQATATWFAFDAGALVVNDGLPLARFPEIQSYPDTEISKKVASGVRTTVNMFIGRVRDDIETKKWNSYFWNRGFDLSDCWTA